MKTTHLLTVKTKYNINIKSPRMIVPQNALLDVYKEETGEIKISLGGPYHASISVSEAGFESFLKRNLFEVVKVQLTRLEADA